MDKISLKVPDLEWIFHKYIPTKAITILAAKGGVGKSALALYIAADIARSKGFKTLYVDLEQTTGHMTERFKKWNLQDVKDYIRVPVTKDEFGNIEHARASMIEIEALGVEHEVKFIVLDSMTSFYDKYDLEKRAPASEFMSDLRRVAVRLNAGLLLLAHTNKLMADSIFQVSSELVTGSAAIIDMARSVLFLSPDKDNIGFKRVQQLKHNFTERQPDFTFKIKDDGISELVQSNNQVEHVCTKLSPTKIAANVNIMMNGLKDGITTKKELRALVINGGGSPMDATNAYNKLVKAGFINAG